MRIIYNVGLFGSTVCAFDLQKLLQMHYQQAHLAGASENLGTSKLSQAEQAQLLLGVNDVSPQMGYKQSEMLMSGLATNSELSEYLKDGYSKTAQAQLHKNLPNIPMADPLYQYSKTNQRSSADTITPNEAIAQYFEEPMKTISMLKAHPNAHVREKGNVLMKKAFTRCLQYNTLEQREACRAK